MIAKGSSFWNDDRIKLPVVSRTNEKNWKKNLFVNEMYASYLASTAIRANFHLITFFAASNSNLATSITRTTMMTIAARPSASTSTSRTWWTSKFTFSCYPCTSRVYYIPRLVTQHSHRPQIISIILSCLFNTEISIYFSDDYLCLFIYALVIFILSYTLTRSLARTHSHTRRK